MRGRGVLFVLVALAILLIAFVLPVGTLVLESLRVRDVVLDDGSVLRAVGDVDRSDGRVIFAMQPEAGGERVPLRLPEARVVEVREGYSFHHYGLVLSDARTRGLVLNSLWIAFGGALAALLLGLPLAWLLFRTDLPGRGLAVALCIGPAVLPPFFVAMGGARPVMNVLTDVLGVSGGTLQVATAMTVFGCVLFPFVLLLVGRSLAAVPAGPWEAAYLLGGRGAAFRRVVLPAVLPPLFGAGALVFVLAWSDFAVPDLLGFMLPPGATPVHVFPTEILLQWKQHATARAVATGVPFLLVTAVLLALALWLLGRSPVSGGGEGRATRPLVRLGRVGHLVGWGVVLAVLAVALVLPVAGVAGWASGGGETVARPGESVPSARAGTLGDISGALDRTPDSREDLARWLKTGIGAALLAMFLAVVLARWALVGGRGARTVVLLAGVLPLAVPGLAWTVSTNLFWNGVDAPWVERTILRSVLALAGRFLPFALLAAWATLREVRRGHEEAAALLGAGPGTRALRIWGPLSWWGLLGGGLAVLVLALREIDTVIEIDARIFPLRIYDKIHFSRLADEANLAFLYLGILMVPAVLAAIVVGWGRHRLKRR